MELFLDWVKIKDNKNLCGRDGRTICGPQCVPRTSVTLAVDEKTLPMATITGRTDRRTERRTERVRRNMRPPPREEGRITRSVMWSETVGLRTRPVWEQKIGLGLGLAGLVLWCETRSCHARRHNDLEGHSNFSSTIYSFSILYWEHHYCGDQQWHHKLLKS